MKQDHHLCQQKLSCSIVCFAPAAYVLSSHREEAENPAILQHTQCLPDFFALHPQLPKFTTHDSTLCASGPEVAEQMRATESERRHS